MTHAGHFRSHRAADPADVKEPRHSPPWEQKDVGYSLTLIDPDIVLSTPDPLQKTTTTRYRVAPLVSAVKVWVPGQSTVYLSLCSELRRAKRERSYLASVTGMN